MCLGEVADIHFDDVFHKSGIPNNPIDVTFCQSNRPIQCLKYLYTIRRGYRSMCVYYTQYTFQYIREFHPKIPKQTRPNSV